MTLRVPAIRMPHRVVLHGPPVPGPAGPVESAPRQVRARVQLKTRLVARPGAEAVTSTAQVELDPENAPEPGSAITTGLGTPYERKARVIRADWIEEPRRAIYVVAYLD